MSPLCGRAAVKRARHTRYKLVTRLHRVHNLAHIRVHIAQRLTRARHGHRAKLSTLSSRYKSVLPGNLLLLLLMELLLLKREEGRRRWALHCAQPLCAGQVDERQRSLAFVLPNAPTQSTMRGATRVYHPQADSTCKQGSCAVHAGNTNEAWARRRPGCRGSSRRL